jgi:hypothetical protein
MRASQATKTAGNALPRPRRTHARNPLAGQISALLTDWRHRGRRRRGVLDTT